MLKPPLILTLSIDENAFNYFNTLRQKHFPPKINYLNAHLTLFHALPNEQFIVDKIKESSKSLEIMCLEVIEPVSIGRGVAFKLESKVLIDLHKELQVAWFDFLTPQDKQKLWPHITIQNKVALQDAQRLLGELKAEFNSFNVTGTGLQLWEYLNGPWQLVDQFRFQQPSY